MGLYDLDGWRIIAYIVGVSVLALFMVEAMMQFTSALLAQPPTRRQRNFIPLSGLRDALLALHGDGYAVAPHGSFGLTVRWDVLGGNPVPPGMRLKLTTTWKTSMLIDQRRREVRWFESVRRSSVFVGFYGWRPLMAFSWWYQGGYLSGVWSGHAYLVTEGFPPRIVDERAFDIDTDRLREAFVAQVTESGWTFRPVTLPFYTSPRWLSLTEHIVPTALTRVSRRGLWSVLYPASYVLVLAFILAPLDGLDWGDLGIIVLVSAAWWGIWGLLAWLLVRGAGRRRPASRRARKRRRGL